MLSSTIRSLEQLKTSDGVNLKSLRTFLDQLQHAGIEIKKPSHLAEDYFCNSIRKPYLSRLIKNLENRFEDKSVMAAFDIFNPAKLPELLDNPSADELEVFMEYGNKQTENLSSQYQGTVDSIQDCLDEWSSYRQFL